MSEWEERPLGDVLDVIIDHRGKTPKKLGGTGFTETGVPVISAIHIKGGRIQWNGRERYVPRWMFEKWMPEQLRRSDVLLTSEAPLGEVTQVQSDEDLVLSQRLFALRGMNGVLNSSFLRYFLETAEGQRRLASRASGTTVVGIRQAELVKVEVPVPPLDEQRRIASVLGAFDDLIETQRTIAQVAEDLWRAVVSSAISEDADRVPLSSLADFVNGRNFTRDANGEGLPVIRTPEVRTGPTESTVYNDVEADETRIAEPGDILFVWSGSLMASRWAWGRGLINQHVFKVIPRGDTPDWLTMFAVEELMDDFLRVAADKATTMGHIKRSDLNSPVATPPPDEWNRLDRVVRPLWDEALSAREHIADLTRTRDELLPLLMSGKVRVDDVEIPKGAA